MNLMICLCIYVGAITWNRELEFECKIAHKTHVHNVKSCQHLILDLAVVFECTC